VTDVQSVRALQGPRCPRKSDIAALNRLFSESFTDRYRRDGLLGVRVPQLNPQIWSYAILDAAEGAMLWFDEKAELIAFNIAHRSGAEGWMGPLAVRSDSQGFGAGKMIVQAAVDWLRRKGASTVGLETMPRTVDNIGFYSRLGFVPQYLTLTMTGDARQRPKNGRLVPLIHLGALLGVATRPDAPTETAVVTRCGAGTVAFAVEEADEVLHQEPNPLPQGYDISWASGVVREGDHVTPIVDVNHLAERLAHVEERS